MYFSFSFCYFSDCYIGSLVGIGYEILQKIQCTLFSFSIFLCRIIQTNRMKMKREKITGWIWWKKKCYFKPKYCEWFLFHIFFFFLATKTTNERQNKTVVWVWFDFGNGIGIFVEWKRKQNEKVIFEQLCSLIFVFGDFVSQLKSGEVI